MPEGVSNSSTLVGSPKRMAGSSAFGVFVKVGVGVGVSVGVGVIASVGTGGCVSVGTAIVLVGALVKVPETAVETKSAVGVGLIGMLQAPSINTRMSKHRYFFIPNPFLRRFQPPSIEIRFSIARL